MEFIGSDDQRRLVRGGDLIIRAGEPSPGLITAQEDVRAVAIIESRGKVSLRALERTGPTAEWIVVCVELHRLPRDRRVLPGSPACG
jgi:hypothetical protein